MPLTIRRQRELIYDNFLWTFLYNSPQILEVTIELFVILIYNCLYRHISFDCEIENDN